MNNAPSLEWERLPPKIKALRWANLRGGDPTAIKMMVKLFLGQHEAARMASARKQQNAAKNAKIITLLACQLCTSSSI